MSTSQKSAALFTGWDSHQHVQAGSQKTGGWDGRWTPRSERDSLRHRARMNPDPYPHMPGQSSLHMLTRAHTSCPGWGWALRADAQARALCRPGAKREHRSCCSKIIKNFKTTPATAAHALTMPTCTNPVSAPTRAAAPLSCRAGAARGWCQKGQSR